ncbi:MAG: hypothetical protein L0I84_01795 [Halomonas subglaciescola]|nr:hypothetical protein [Halomonas subglaciescola]
MNRNKAPSLSLRLAAMFALVTALLLRERPQLYANMLGNTEHFFWVLDSTASR